MFKRIASRLPWMVLLGGLLISVASYNWVQSIIHTQELERFQNVTEKVKESIHQRFNSYITVLMGGRGFFENSPSFTSKEWQNYVSNLEIHQYYKGLIGMGFISSVNKAEKEAYLERIRKSVGSNFEIKPKGERKDYFVIDHIEPLEKNLLAWGYDIGSENIRRLAAEEARDTGLPVITQKIILVQDTEKQPSFLLLLPVYKQGTHPTTVEERRKSLVGWVYAPLQMEKLMESLMGKGVPEVDFEIFQGKGDRNRETLLYDDDKSLHAIDKFYKPDFQTVSHMDVAGKTWSIYFTTRSGFKRTSEKIIPWLALSIGVLLSSTSAIFISSILNKRAAALELAAEMTSKYLSREKYLRLQYKISTLYSETFPTNEIFQKTLFLLCSEMGWEAGSTWKVDEAAKVLRLQDFYGKAGKDFSAFETISRSLEFTSGTGLPGRVWKDAKPHWIADLTKDSNFPRIRAATKSNLRSGLAFPVFFENKLNYIIEIFDSHIQQPDEALLQTLASCSAQIGQLIEQKQTQEALKASTRSLSDIKLALDHSFIVAITDAKGSIVYANDKFCEISKYSREELLGKDHRIINSGYHSKEFIADLWKTITSGKIWHGEICNKAKDGTFYWVNTTITPFLDSSGKPYQYVAVRHDITGRKKIEEELVHSKESAEAANMAKSSFLANMSHEIRTPMNGVIGMINLLLNTELNEKQTRFASTIRKSSENLLAILNDILDFSKIESGKLTFESINFDLEEIIYETMDLLKIRTDGKDVELICSIAPDVPRYLAGDPVRLRQVVNNLMGNGIKFTEQGEVGLFVSLVKETDAEATLHFKIIDTGVGISKEAQGKLFHPFSQADTSTTRKYGGTGLGLVICRQLIQKMGGELSLESIPGKGSTFSFDINFRKSDVKMTLLKDGNEKKGGTEENLEGIPVLVVDDNATNREVLHHLLTSWRMNCTAASNAGQALNLLNKQENEKNPFVFAILDMQMPGMDGMTLAKTIKTLPHLKSTKIILATSLGDHLDEISIGKLGICSFLNKPIRQTDLYKALIQNVGAGSSNPKEVAVAREKEKIASQNTFQNMVLNQNVQILIAEDNATNQEVAAGMLEMMGYHKLDIVGNGKTALEAIKNKSYDIVFMDCQMPVLDGYEATRAIRENEKNNLNPKTPPLYIIAMTANALVGDKEKCIAAGMNGYIGKPLQAKDLEIALKQWEKQDTMDNQSPKEPVNKTPSPPPPTLIDMDRLKEITFGDPARRKKLLTGYFKDGKLMFETLDQALKENDFQKIKQVTHKFGGASISIGMNGLANLLREIEIKADQGSLESSPDLLMKVGESLKKCEELLLKEVF